MTQLIQLKKRIKYERQAYAKNGLNPRYTQELKYAAVTHAKNEGISGTKMAKLLGVTPPAFYRWVKKLKGHELRSSDSSIGSSSFPQPHYPPL